MIIMILINLDYQSRTPIYEQIVSNIEKYVALGVLKPNEQIPSIRELASNLGINPNTVKKAYDILEHKKVITSFSTKGTFISSKTDEVLENRKQEEIKKLEQVINSLQSLGMSKKEILEFIKKVAE